MFEVSQAGNFPSAGWLVARCAPRPRAAALAGGNMVLRHAGLPSRHGRVLAGGPEDAGARPTLQIMGARPLRPRPFIYSAYAGLVFAAGMRQAGQLLVQSVTLVVGLVQFSLELLGHFGILLVQSGETGFARPGRPAVRRWDPWCSPAGRDSCLPWPVRG